MIGPPPSPVNNEQGRPGSPDGEFWVKFLKKFLRKIIDKSKLVGVSYHLLPNALGKISLGGPA
jgi:hypothetical protein